MSVTFFIPQAPVERVKLPCAACDGTGVDSIDGRDYPCPYCDGVGYDWVVREAAPFFDINMANSNAHAVLAMIVPPQVECDPSCGEWSGEALDVIYQQTMRVRNTKARKALEVPTVSEGNWTTMGRDEDYVTRRLDEFLRLLALAREHGFNVCYG
jgi:hypothetical protein